jgi:hypothetical protein
MAISPNGQIYPDFNAVSSSRVSGPLESLYKNQYSFQTRYYPRNLATDQRGHHIMFYINVAQNTESTGPSNGAGGEYDYALNREGNQFPGVSGSEKGKLINVPFTTDPNTGNERTINLARKTKRIKTAVALYMPENINVQYSANFQDTSLTNAFGNFGAILQNVDSVRDSVESAWKTDWNNAISTVANGLTAPALEATSLYAGSIFGQDASDFVLFAGGYAINPQLEVLFKGINLRSFQFDFVFSPFSRDEAQSVKDIIETFKFHAAPEILEKAGNGRYMVPPSEFDIEFMYKGQENRNIHKIGTCVLTNIAVDYSPDGWSTFGGDPGAVGAGFPTQTKLTLQFMETDIITKNKISQGY